MHTDGFTNWKKKLENVQIDKGKNKNDKKQQQWERVKCDSDKYNTVVDRHDTTMGSYSISNGKNSS